MPCIICGDPATIEAHILPRALYRRLAGADQHAIAGNLFREGIQYQAKGVFDRDLLCRTHEEMLGSADDYGLRFLRWFETKSKVGVLGKVWLVPNPKPDLLVRFVAACIWRRGVSPVGRGLADTDLGLAEPKLRAMLFASDTAYKPPLMLIRRRFTSQGIPLGDIMFEPCKGDVYGDNSWAMFALGCEFIMKLNPYGNPPFPPNFMANQKTEVWAKNPDPQEFTQMPNAIEIGINMLRGERKIKR